jgi:hypothetical protein
MRELLLSIGFLFGMLTTAPAVTVTPVGTSTGTIQNSSTLQTGATFYVSSGTVKNLNVSTMNVTTGMTMNGVAPSSGAYLSGQGVGVAPVWSFAGKIMQIKSAVCVSSASAASTFVNTGCSVSITPLRASSTIYIQANGTIYQNNNGGANVTLARDGVNLSPNVNGMSEIGIGGASAQIVPSSMAYFDYPNTTSATVYAVYMKVTAAPTTSVGWGLGYSNFGMIYVVEIGN